jgi:hypothetical protein
MAGPPTINGISDLVPTDPPGTDFVDEGDDWIRAIQESIQDSFVNWTNSVDDKVLKTGPEIDACLSNDEDGQITGVWEFVQSVIIRQLTETIPASLEWLGATGFRAWQWTMQDENHAVPFAMQLRRHDRTDGVIQGVAAEIDPATGSWVFELDIDTSSGQYITALGSAAAPAMYQKGAATTGVYWDNDSFNVGVLATRRFTVDNDKVDIIHPLDVSGSVELGSTLDVVGDVTCDDGLQVDGPLVFDTIFNDIDPVGNDNHRLPVRNVSGSIVGYLVVFGA